MSAASRYAGSRVLVTGATGFKGSWLSWWLLELGATVRALSLPPPTSPSLFEHSGLGRHLDWSRTDVRDFEAVAREVRSFVPDVVFHLAAQALVRPSYRDPVETLATNAMGTAHLLEAVRLADRPCGVVVVSSDKCYLDRAWDHAYREDDALGGSDPYSASKGCTEIVTGSWRSSFFPPDRMGAHGVAVASARAGNVIGPGDHAPERLVPDCIRALTAGAPIRLRRPGAIRPWQHVLEPLSGYLELGARLHPDAPEAERRAACSAWNFGPTPEAAVPVRELVEALISAWGSGSWLDVSDPDAPHESPALRLAIDKAVGRLGWRPTWGLPETLRRTAQGYRHLAAARPEAAEAYLRGEIAAFTRAAAPAAAVLTEVPWAAAGAAGA